MYNDLNDIELLNLMKVGNDKLAFTELYNRYWDKLFIVACNRINSESLAEELVQDIFLDLWNRRIVIEISISLSSYLAAAMKNRVINAHIKNVHARDYQEYAVRYLPASVNNTEEWLGFKELRSHLEALVKNLPTKARLTYQYSKELGLSNREIAAEMNVSEKAVEHNLTRAMKSLRTGLKNLLPALLSFLIK